MAKKFHFTTKNPEQARWAYLARSGDQLEHGIRFILQPAHKSCHINKCTDYSRCTVFLTVQSLNFAFALSNNFVLAFS